MKPMVVVERVKPHAMRQLSHLVDTSVLLSRMFQIRQVPTGGHGMQCRGSEMWRAR